MPYAACDGYLFWGVGLGGDVIYSAVRKGKVGQGRVVCALS